MTDQPPLAKPTDAPVQPATVPPPGFLDRTQGFIGNIARPLAIIMTAASASTATIIIALKNTDGFSAAAIFIGAVFTGLAALYGAKSWEVAQTDKHAASVAVAQANASTTGTA